jgi:hypothetical protein
VGGISVLEHPLGEGSLNNLWKTIDVLKLKLGGVLKLLITPMVHFFGPMSYHVPFLYSDPFLTFLDSKTTVGNINPIT